MPSYDSRVHLASAQAFFVTPTKGEVSIIRQQTWGGSLLAKSFNMLWAMALAHADKEQCEWFAMLHADIGPEAGWVDILVKEAIIHDADMVSAVIPMKSPKGLTSTGLDNPENEFEPMRRMTMREVWQPEIPDTFTAADLGQTELALLVNTGCFVARTNRKWCRATDERGFLKSRFSIDDRIARIDGMWNVGVSPEDWQFSRMLHEAGAKVMATRKVKAVHYGETGYRNDVPWGTCENDDETRKTWEARNCSIITDGKEPASAS